MKLFKLILIGLALLNLCGYLWLSLIPSKFCGDGLVVSDLDELANKSDQEKITALEMQWEFDRAQLARAEKREFPTELAEGLLLVNALVLILVLAISEGVEKALAQEKTEESA